MRIDDTLALHLPVPVTARVSRGVATTLSNRPGHHAAARAAVLRSGLGRLFEGLPREGELLTRPPGADRAIETYLALGRLADPLGAPRSVFVDSYA